MPIASYYSVTIRRRNGLQFGENKIKLCQTGETLFWSLLLKLSAVHDCIIHHPFLLKLPKQSHNKLTQITSQHDMQAGYTIGRSSHYLAMLTEASRAYQLRVVLPIGTCWMTLVTSLSPVAIAVPTGSLLSLSVGAITWHDH